MSMGFIECVIDDTSWDLYYTVTAEGSGFITEIAVLEGAEAGVGYCGSASGPYGHYKLVWTPAL